MTDEFSNEVDDERTGIGRRSMIKRAAAAGVVAWTAPVILDSLASPAAAASCTSCFKFEFPGNDDGKSTTTTTEGWRSYITDAYKNTGTFISRVGNGSVQTQSNSSSAFSVAGESKCTTAIDNNQSLATLGATLSGTFELSQRGAPTGTVTLAQTTSKFGTGVKFNGGSTFAGCNGPLQLQGAGMVFRDASSPLNYWAQSASPTDTLPTPFLTSATTSPTQTGFPGLITSISTSSVTFTMPGSSGDSSSGNSWSTNKPGHSGAFMFVVGCNCG